MHKREWDLLFWEHDLRSVLDAQLEKVSEDVIRIPRERFTSESNELLSAEVASKLVVSPIELLEEEIEVSTADTKVDITHDRHRAPWDPTHVDGIEVTYHVPYRGDQALLKCKPSTFTLNPPRAVIQKHELRYPYDSADKNVAATKRFFDDDLRALKEWLPRVNAQVDEYNGALESRVSQQIQQRRSQLEREKSDVESLGFKVRGPKMAAAPTRAERVETRKRVRESANREYDVALSFAGEDRAYVEQVARDLKNSDVSVFYDGFEQVGLWGKDLGEHLGEVYGKRSRFVVLFLSRAYATKAWPTHEKRFALGSHLAGRKNRVLPVRFDDTEIPGLAPTIGYLDLRVLTPQKLAELIRQKLDATEGDA